jgi:hypothetical protein
MIGHKNSRDKRKMSALSTHFDRYHSKDDKLPVCTIGAAKKQINSPKAYALGELLVRVTAVEPARRAAPDPKSGASANSAIPAYQPFVGANLIVPAQNRFVNHTFFLCSSTNSLIIKINKAVRCGAA